MLTLYSNVYNHGVDPATLNKSEKVYGIGSGYRFQLRMLLDFDKHHLKNPYLSEIEESFFDIAMNSFEDPFAVYFTKVVLSSAKRGFVSNHT